MQINGEKHEADCWEGESLLFALREKLGFPGAKNACEQGECGSCSVLLDGVLVCACLVLAAQADGHEVTTVEGLADGDSLHGVQQAFVAAGAVQCGFCTPGLVVATVDLLRRNSSPSDDEIREALSGNLCRCTGYAKIFDAVRMAAGNDPDRAHASDRQDRGAPPADRCTAEGEGRVRVRQRPDRAGDALGPHAAQSSCTRADRRARHLGRRLDARRARGAHPCRCPGREVLRARVSGSTGARHRSGPLLRRAGRSRRRGAPGAGSASGRAHPRRVRAARAGRRHGAGDRAGRPAPREADARPRLLRRSSPECRAAHPNPARRPRSGGRRVGERGLRRRNPGSGVSRARVGPRRAGRRRRRRYLRRDAVAACRPRTGRAVPRPAAGAGSDPPQWRGRRIRRPRRPLHAGARRDARACTPIVPSRSSTTARSRSPAMCTAIRRGSGASIARRATDGSSTCA